MFEGPGAFPRRLIGQHVASGFSRTLDFRLKAEATVEFFRNPLWEIR